MDLILSYTGLDLDLKHCDPQGHTVFLSICRSSISADARTDAVLHDVEGSRISGSRKINPFAATALNSSLFNTLRARGASLLAVDHSGKNTLHHLLESAFPKRTTTDQQKSAAHCNTCCSTARPWSINQIIMALTQFIRHYSVYVDILSAGRRRRLQDLIRW